MLDIAIPESVAMRVAELCRLTGRSPDEFVLEALEAHIEELKDACLAMERLKNPARRWTLEDLENGRDLAR